MSTQFEFCNQGDPAYPEEIYFEESSSRYTLELLFRSIFDDNTYVFTLLELDRKNLEALRDSGLTEMLHVIPPEDHPDIVDFYISFTGSRIYLAVEFKDSDLGTEKFDISYNRPKFLNHIRNLIEDHEIK